MNCLWCHEEVLPGEASAMMRCQPFHDECGVRMVVGSVGHLQHKCSCYGGTAGDPEGMSLRQAAVAARVIFEMRVPRTERGFAA